MSYKEIRTYYSNILDSLNQGALKTAFDMLQGLISVTHSHSHQSKLTEMQETYQYMLRYYVEGMSDPLQGQIYTNLCSSAYEMADHILHSSLYSGSPHIFYAMQRNMSVQPDETATYIRQIQGSYDIEDFTRYESSVDLLFNRIWSTAFLSDNDLIPIREALRSKDFPTSAKCQIVSALLLGLQISFDKAKMYTLFDAAHVEDIEVKIRAIIAICLTLYIYRNRTAYYPDIRKRLEILGESPDFGRILTMVNMRFILTRETEKVTRKLQEEMLPEMLKFAKKNKGMIITDFSDPVDDEMNPEWKDIIADSNLQKKLEEYSELQEEGVDIMHSTFIHLKNFHFFKNISNWFLPFYINHSVLNDKHNIDVATLESLMQVSFMCNSDKYSMYLSLFQIPEDQRNAMLHQLNSQLNELNNQQALELKNKKCEAESIAGQYIHDLYRFFKLYPRRAEFDDIFSHSLDFHMLPLLKPWFSDPATLLQIAELYLRKGYFNNALPIYNQLISNDSIDYMLFQKRGYCKQMTDDLAGALEDYLRSEMINPDSKWVIRRIAGCYRALKQPVRALEFYLRFEKLSPGNTSILINMGHCYLELKNFDEALNYYFKADYLDSKSQKAQRAIAWCSFLTGKFSQARKYYEKILESHPQTHDYLNAGHTEWLLRNFKKALDYYVQAIRSESDDFNKFAELFKLDVPDLIQAGVSPSEIPLLLDWLQYFRQ
ncbi:MAG: tetratricopeptide repeat protein [Tannerella sp.]|jgi:tetratricopeptide (TPR) repeat protein|nr:tetratricopeptide repeat protein [Tannerella sp.]